jgi:hypothetical protein
MHDIVVWRGRSALTLSAILSVWMLVSTHGAAAFDRRVALVIGNSNYQVAGVLQNPRNDAEDIAEKLRALGFQVFDGVDLTKSDMDRLIREFSTALDNAALGLFFYAGHGIQADGTNYLVPIDARANSSAALDFEMVRVDLVQFHVREGPRHVRHRRMPSYPGAGACGDVGTRPRHDPKSQSLGAVEWLRIVRCPHVAARGTAQGSSKVSWERRASRWSLSARRAVRAPPPGLTVL